MRGRTSDDDHTSDFQRLLQRTPGGEEAAKAGCGVGESVHSER